MKYVMYKITRKGLVQFNPIIFPNMLVHAMMNDLVMAKAHELWPNALNVVADSAGEMSSVTLQCSGMSESMNGLKSKPKRDTLIIISMDYGHGIL